MRIGLDEVPVAALVVDADRRITAANDLAAGLLGRPVDDVVGLSLDEVAAAAPEGEDVPPWSATWAASPGGRPVAELADLDVDVRTGDGGLRRCRVAGRYRRGSDGALQGAVLTVLPVQGGDDDAPSAIEIVSTVSHELRSPLTSVKGYTSLLLNRWDRVDDAQKQDMLRQVHRDADRVTRLVTELLDISRLEVGRLPLRRQMVDLAVVARAVVADVGAAYDDLDCVVAFPDDLPHVYADPDKVQQVLRNLVENAAKYASRGGMSISGSLEDGAVAVAVRDRGRGIPASDLPRVFTKFFRRDVGRPTGTGLGLWISRGLVEAHGGTLTAHSTLGEGTTFRFTLPTDAFEKLLEPQEP